MNEEDAANQSAIKRFKTRLEPVFHGEVDGIERLECNGSHGSPWNVSAGRDESMPCESESPGHTSGVVSSASDGGCTSDASSCSAATPTPMAAADGAPGDVDDVVSPTSFGGAGFPPTSVPRSLLGQGPLFPGGVGAGHRLHHPVARARVRTKKKASLSSLPLAECLPSKSKFAPVELRILNQPETQHRARYLTEGSRGAIKDRSGEGYPVVKLVGYPKPANLQVFIGTDQGKAAPHMFYQACRVFGKNSTPCKETRVNGTVVLEIALDPGKDMTVSCDCVGILKERNVDVEQRFPSHAANPVRKKSTRCRLVFRAAITHDDGREEILQTVSQPISCTQPPGVPEILKKSMASCSVEGGEELIILGKNFLKDSKIVFRAACQSESEDGDFEPWEVQVIPQKEFLHQLHLVCVVPAFKELNTKKPVDAEVVIVSGGRVSEPHPFVFTPMLPSLTPLQASLPEISGGSHSPEMTLPKGVAARALEINRNFALQHAATFKIDSPSVGVVGACQPPAGMDAAASMDVQPAVFQGQMPGVCGMKSAFTGTVSALPKYVALTEEERAGKSMLHEMQKVNIVPVPYVLTSSKPMQDMASTSAGGSPVDEKILPAPVDDQQQRFVITQLNPSAAAAGPSNAGQDRRNQQQQEAAMMAVSVVVEPTKLSEFNIPPNVIITSAAPCCKVEDVPEAAAAEPETSKDGGAAAAATPTPTADQLHHMQEIMALTKRIQEHISCIPGVADDGQQQQPLPQPASEPATAAVPEAATDERGRAADVANRMAAVYDSLRSSFPNVDEKAGAQAAAVATVAAAGAGAAQVVNAAEFCRQRGTLTSNVVLPATLEIEPAPSRDFQHHQDAFGVVEHCSQQQQQQSSSSAMRRMSECHQTIAGGVGGKIIILSPTTLDFNSGPSQPQQPLLDDMVASTAAASSGVAGNVQMLNDSVYIEHQTAVHGVGVGSDAVGGVVVEDMKDDFPSLPPEADQLFSGLSSVERAVVEDPHERRESVLQLLLPASPSSTSSSSSAAAAVAAAVGMDVDLPSSSRVVQRQPPSEPMDASSSSSSMRPPSQVAQVQPFPAHHLQQQHQHHHQHQHQHQHHHHHPPPQTGGHMSIDAVMALPADALAGYVPGNGSVLISMSSTAADGSRIQRGC